MDLMGGASRDPVAAQKSLDTLKGLASGLVNEGPRIMKELDSAGEAIRKGDWGMAAHHAAGAAPFIGAAVQNAGAELERGDTSAAAGHTAALFAPFVAAKAPALARAAADTDAGAAVIGGVKGAAKAATETVPLTRMGVNISLPKPLVTGAAAATAARAVGLPHELGAAVGAAAPIVRGAFKGAKAAIAERKLAAGAATLPPDVISELTRESGPPQAPPEYQRPQGQPAPIPSPPAAWEGEAQLERLRADQASRAATGPVPVQQPRLLEAGPPVRQMEAPPDPSFVRAVPAQYPAVEQPSTIAEQVKQQYAGSPADPPVAPPEPQIGTETAAPAVDPQKSQFHANGERKSPQFRGAEKAAENTSAKAQRWADAFEKNGITPEIARKIQGGRVSDTQIQKGMAPRWENVLDDLVARGHLEAGETVPKSSLGEIIAELEKRESSKATEGAPKETAPQSQTKKNPRDMTRSELAKQAGLPENATPDQIMKALADAMEEDKPKAATAGKGK